ncbi:MAG: hypothetical protein NT023_24030 [Armatimonadetes bacterium]|nr:hypothetical protein [Armatimonadota bacterium]
MRSDISLLDKMKISAPCLESWEAMEGDERVRHCNDCKQNVYNLSGMTQSEAEDILQTHEGRLCVRYYQRSNGSIMTKDCPTGLHALRQRALKKWIAISYAVAALAVGFWRVAGSRIYEANREGEAFARAAEEPNRNLANQPTFAPAGTPVHKQETASEKPSRVLMGAVEFMPPKK